MLPDRHRQSTRTRRTGLAEKVVVLLVFVFATLRFIYPKRTLSCSYRLFIVGGVFQIQDLNMAVEGLEKERDFYFGKLRDVEVLCQEHENEDFPLVKQILDILYATEVSLA